MHVDRGKRTRFIGVGELYPTSCHAFGPVERVMRHLRVPLKELPRRKVDRAFQFGDPGVIAQIRIRARGRLATLELFRVYFLNVRVIDHRDGVAVRTVFDTVDAPR